jgi:hypothetical protein
MEIHLSLISPTGEASATKSCHPISATDNGKLTWYQSNADARRSLFWIGMSYLRILLEQLQPVARKR